MKRFLGVLAAALALPVAGAPAHVQIKPQRAPAGSEARLTLEVPNERPAARTRRIDVQLPAGVSSVEARTLRGWRLSTSGNRRASLTAPPGRALSGDQRGRFGLVVGLPPRPGATLTFKVLQTYDSGEVVRWIGPPGTSEPAARLRLTAAREPPQEQPPGEPQETTPQQEPGGDAGAEDDGGDGGGVPIPVGIGLILLAAVAGTLSARARNRRRMSRSSQD